MKYNTLFMAFSSGKESTEGSSIKRYIGVAPVTVLAVNPSKAEMEKIYNTTFDKEPEYVGSVERDGAKVENARISFIVKTVADKCNDIDQIFNVTFFVQKAPRIGSQSGKYQIIDKYGRTAWATKEDIDNHRIPMYKEGTVAANIDADYRPAFVGEEELTSFIKTYLNIPNIQVYKEGKWVMYDRPEECEARLDHIKDYFNNNFSELKTICNLQPNNKVKVLVGVKTTDEGREIQNVYTRMFLKNGVTDYSRLDADVKEAKNAGSYSSTVFEVVPLKEYMVTPTDIKEEVKPTTNWFD